MIVMLTSIARSLVSTEESIAMPCSVKASGLLPPRLRREGITFCDRNASTSSSDSSNRKSGGTLRANINETFLAAQIREQGEKEMKHDRGAEGCFGRAG